MSGELGFLENQGKVKSYRSCNGKIGNEKL